MDMERNTKKYNSLNGAMNRHFETNMRSEVQVGMPDVLSAA
jgi:hypothetical protein